MTPIRGAGGSSKGGGTAARSAQEAPDSLRSVQYARIIDVVSEGEIGGLVDGLKSIYLDGTPLQNADDSYNFNGVTVVTRNGTQAQDYVPGFPASESEVTVGVEVREGAPVTRTISSTSVDAVRVTLSVPQLTQQNTENGDVSGTSVEHAIDLQDNGGGFVEVLRDTISGKTTSRYQRSYRIELTGTGPWDIRVRRITANSSSGALVNKGYWDSYTQLVDAKLSYPNSALVALMVNAEQFRGIPTRGYEIYGMIVRVPSNYDPETRAYTGAWDGTFQVAWTDNPAWCFYDLVTNERYGLGAFISASQVNKWVLYQIAQYCDELVPDGYGGTEPRFTCNLFLQSREEAYRVVLNMASIFRGMVYWSAGSLVTVQDAPSDPVAHFTPANVIDGAFTYSGSSARKRHTVALVSWNDPDDQYKQKIEYVEDADGIDRYGVVQSEIVAFGCTSRGQAHRLGRWMLYSERTETETVTFKTGLESVLCAPGQIIHTSDPVRAGVRFGGRVTSATVNAVSIDAPVTIEAANTYTLWATLPDGTIESRAVSTGAGTVSTLTVSTAFSDAPQDGAIWVLAANDLEPETWRVVSIVEIEQTQAEITAVAHNPDKFDAVEQGLLLEELQTTNLRAIPDAPDNLAVSEELYLVTPVVVGNRVTLSWTGRAAYYEVQYSREGDNPTILTTPQTAVDIQPAPAGDYTFRVTAVNALGLRSVPAVLTQTIRGLSAPPSDVAGLQMVALSGYAHLTWNPATDLDVVIGGSIRIRYTPDTSDPDWSSAVDIGPAIPGTSTNITLPLLAGSYLAKWVDSGGMESGAAAFISTDAANIQALNVVETLQEDPDFPGDKNNTAVSGVGLVLDSLETIGDQTDPVSAWPLISALGGGVVSEGSYLFSDVVDLGSVQTARVTSAMTVTGFDALDLISYRPLVSTWPSVIGDIVSDVEASLYIRTTNDDPGGSPVWSEWQQFFVGDWTARAFEFKVILASGFVTHNVAVSELVVSIDMPDRVQAADDVVSGTGAHAVTFVSPFMVPPAVGVTAQDMGTGDFYTITSKTETGFSIRFKNAAGADVSRTFDWIAKGY